MISRPTTALTLVLGTLLLAGASVLVAVAGAPAPAECPAAAGLPLAAYLERAEIDRAAVTERLAAAGVDWSDERATIGVIARTHGLTPAALCAAIGGHGADEAAPARTPLDGLLDAPGERRGGETPACPFPAGGQAPPVCGT